MLKSIAFCLSGLLFRIYVVKSCKINPVFAKNAYFS